MAACVPTATPSTAADVRHYGGGTSIVEKLTASGSLPAPGWARRGRSCSGAGARCRSPAAPTPAGRGGSTRRCRFRRRGRRHLHQGHAGAPAASRQLPAVRSARTRQRRDGGRRASRDGGPPRGGRWPRGANPRVHRPEGGHPRLRRAGEPVGGRAGLAVAGRGDQPAGGGEVTVGTRPEAVAVTRRSIGRPRAETGGAASGGVVLTTLADHQGLDVLACCGWRARGTSRWSWPRWPRGSGGTRRSTKCLGGCGAGGSARARAA